MVNRNNSFDVWFDHQIFSVQEYGGVSRYFYELSKKLTEQNDVQPCIFAPAHVNGYLRRGDAGGLIGCYIPFPQKGLRFRPILLAPLLRVALKIYKPKILHETDYGLSGEHVGKGLNIVTTVHDMIFEKFPAMLDKNTERVAMKYRAINRADQIICVSENTKHDLLGFYPEFADKTVVVYHGVTYVEPDESAKVLFPEPFILFVGTRYEYKNFTRLVKAIGTSKFLKENFGLVLFGGGELTKNEIAVIRESGISEQRVIQISGSDELLSLAYSRATVFVSPSLYEGFGMPLTEAMTHGLPIICSQSSSYIEICGSAAQYFDASDVDSICFALEEVLNSSEKLENLSRASRDRSGYFSWQKCAEEMSKIYKKLM